MKQKGAAYKGAVFGRVQMGKMLFWLLACLMAFAPNLPLAQAAVGNGKIVFQSDRNANYDIYIINPDGSGETRLTTNIGKDQRPMFNPDSSKIAFYSNRDGNWQIYIMNPDGTNQTRLNASSSNDSFPIFSPDGGKILFSSDRDTGLPSARELYVMDVTGNNVKRLTNTNRNNFMARFSRDGSKIVFVSNRDNNEEIYVMNSDGSNQNRLTTNTHTDWHPCFSPDGNKIIFTSGRTGYFQIFLMNADGSNQVEFTHNQSQWVDYHPCYSPDGTKIGFASGRNGAYEIYYMNLDGSNPTRVTNNPAYDQPLDWGAVVLPSLSIANVAQPEGSASSPGSATFTVTLSPASTQIVTVNYATANGTASNGTDYTGKSSTLSFAPGETSKTITVNFLGDENVEGDETFFVNLSQPTNAALTAAQGVGVIVNDDAVVPTLSIADATASEGSASAPGSATFRVTLSPSVAQNVSVNYATANSSAIAGSDYNEQSGVLSFAPGETSKTITVNFVGDTVQEGDETFAINLSQPTGAVLSRAQATGTIINDDVGPLPSISINDVTLTEGNAGIVYAVFTVTLTQSSAQSVSVDYLVNSDTATTPVDFTSVNGSLIFTPGQVSKNISVPVRGDTLDEINETFRVLLTNTANALVNDGQGQGTITDDDARPTISVNDVIVSEGNSATVNATFTITLSAASGQAVSVNLVTNNGTALTPGDYTGSSAQLSFAPGERSKTFTVPVKGDLLNEADEIFYVLLSLPVNVGILRGRGGATIFDDDATPSITIEGISIGEGNSGQRTASFRLKLSAASGRIVKASYATGQRLPETIMWLWRPHRSLLGSAAFMPMREFLSTAMCSTNPMKVLRSL
jgi:Tol biopolymer transport system component